MHEKSNVYRVVWLMIIHKLDYMSGMHIQIKDQEVKGTLLVGVTWNANVVRFEELRGRQPSTVSSWRREYMEQACEDQSEKKVWNSGLWKEWFRQISLLLTNLYGNNKVDMIQWRWHALNILLYGSFQFPALNGLIPNGSYQSFHSLTCLAYGS